MALPKIEHPIYEVNLISFKKPVKYRPFLVKEQKILLMASESKEFKTIVEAIKQVIKNCVLDKNIDVDKLPVVDVETFFLNLRAKSVGEKLNLFFKCQNKINNEKCNMVIDVEIDLLQEVSVKNLRADNIIKINDTIGVKMSYPTFEDLSLISNLHKKDNYDLYSVASCIDQIFDKEQTYNAKEASIEELIEFIESLPGPEYRKMQNFVENSPKNSYEKNHVCPKCSHLHKIKVEGLEDFFI